MEKVWNVVKNKSLFKVLYIMFLCVYMVPIINVLSITRVFLVIFAMWASILVLMELSQKQLDYFKEQHHLIMTILFSVFLLTYLVNFQNNGLHSIGQLFFYAICVFVLFSFDDVKHLKSDMLNICNGYIAVNLVTTMISNIMYIFQLYYEMESRAGVLVRLGVAENRLFGLYTSSNVGGTFAVLGIMMVLFVVFVQRKELKTWKKVLYSAYSVSAYIYITMSLSRGTYLCAFGVIAFFVFFFIKSEKKDIKSVVFKKLTGVLIAAISVYAMTTVVQSGMLAIANGVQHILGGFEENADGAEEEEKEEIVAERIESGDDISNKRFAIWKASFNIAKNDLLTGVGNAYAAYENQKDSKNLSVEDKIYLDFSKGNTHNGYLQIIVECGLIAFAIYIYYIVVLAVRAFKGLYYLRSKRETYNVLLVALCPIAYILLNNFFETNMALMGTNAFQAILWIFIGFVVIYLKNMDNDSMILDGI